MATSFLCKNFQSSLNEPQLVSPAPQALQWENYYKKKRLIFDLSAPHSGTIPSINSLIPLELWLLLYSTVDHAINLIKIASRGTWLSKADITHLK